MYCFVQYLLKYIFKLQTTWHKTERAFYCNETDSSLSE